MKKARKWSYQLDESTDTGKNVQLMVYVSYEGDTDLEKESLLCTPLSTTATGANIFNVVPNFQKKKTLTGKIVSAYALTALLMIGARQGFTARVKQVNPNVLVIHYLLHRENLTAQHLSPALSAVMQEIITVVNFIKSSAVNSGPFEQMCVDFGSEFQHLLFYFNARWLSRSKLLRRVVDL